MSSQLTKAYFRKEADALKEACRQRKLARERAKEEVEWLLRTAFRRRAERMSNE